MLRFTLLYLLAISFATVSAPTLRYDASASRKWVPYYTGKPETPGIVHELLTTILVEAGIRPQPISLPPKRTLLALEKGELDFHVMSKAWFPGGDYGKDYVLSAPFLSVEEFVITLASMQANWQHKDSLKDAQVGTIAGYFYHDMHDFVRMDFPSEQELLQALSLGRVEVAIIGDLPGHYWSRRMGIAVSWLRLHSTGELHMRIRKDKAEVLPAINASISRLREQGVLQSVMEKYRALYDL